MEQCAWKRPPPPWECREGFTEEVSAVLSSEGVQMSD